MKSFQFPLGTASITSRMNSLRVATIYSILAHSTVWLTHVFTRMGTPADM
jgi:hypothetical protein